MEITDLSIVPRLSILADLDKPGYESELNAKILVSLVIHKPRS